MTKFVGPIARDSQAGRLFSAKHSLPKNRKIDYHAPVDEIELNNGRRPGAGSDRVAGAPLGSEGGPAKGEGATKKPLDNFEAACFSGRGTDVLCKEADERSLPGYGGANSLKSPDSDERIQGNPRKTKELRSAKIR
jgi:hypothetical protein